MNDDFLITLKEVIKNKRISLENLEKHPLSDARIQDSIFFKNIQKIVYISTLHATSKIVFLDFMKGSIQKEISTKGKRFFNLMKHPDPSFPSTFFVTVGKGKVFTLCAEKEEKIGELISEENIRRENRDHTLFKISTDMILHGFSYGDNESGINKFDFIVLKGPTKTNAEIVKSIDFDDEKFKIYFRWNSHIRISQDYKNSLYFNTYNDRDDDFIHLLDFEKETIIKEFSYRSNYITALEIFYQKNNEVLVYVLSEDELCMNYITFQRVRDEKILKKFKLSEDFLLEYFFMLGNRYLFSSDDGNGYIFGIEIGSFLEDELEVNFMFHKKVSNNAIKKMVFYSSYSTNEGDEEYVDFVNVCSNSIEKLRIHGISKPKDNLLWNIQIQDLTERIEFVLNQKEEYIFNESLISNFFCKICLRNVNLVNILKILL